MLPRSLTTSISILVMALSAAVPGLAQEKERLSHEALYQMPRVGSPNPSPDGRWVVFSLTEPSYEEDKDVTDLFIVPEDGTAEPRRITSGQGAEGDAVWSPDSTRIAFTAKRGDDEKDQIYILDLARGGEAQRLTDISTGARRPRWSPDGTRLLFQSSVYPGTATDEDNRAIAEKREKDKSNVLIFETFPIRRWDRWLDDKQTHLFVVNEKGEESDLFAGTELVKSPGFRGRNGRSGDDLDAAWTPDGHTILFVATRENDRAARAKVRTHLYSIPAVGGEPTALTKGDWSYTGPKFRPDGKSVCFSMADESDDVYYSLDQIGCAAWPWNGEIASLTFSLDRSAGDFAFSPDSRSVFFLANDSGRVRIHSVPSRGGQVKVAAENATGVYGGLEIPPKARRPILFATWESAISPAEIVRIDPARGERVFLTRFNTEKAASLDWEPLREFWYTNDQGRRIHAWVALPPGFDETRQYPMFVLIHGGHASTWQDRISLRWNYHLLAQPNLVVVAPDYRGSVGHGLQLTLDILGDPLRGPVDDVNAAADEAIRLFPFIDETRQAAGGASYGGHMVNWLEATSDRYRCLVSHAGLASLDMQWATSDVIHHREMMMGEPFWDNPEAWLDQSPIAKGGNFKTPMLLSVGGKDYRVPMNNTLAMWSVLQRMNVPGKLLIWPDENHWILNPENSRVFYREVGEWLTKWLDE